MRRLSIVIAVVLGLLGAVAPHTHAATGFVAAMASCSVTRLAVATVDGCPAVKDGLAGYASATAVANLSAQTFDVASAVRPGPARAGINSARSQLDLVSSVVITSTGGRVKIVLTNVSGGTSRSCVRLCAQVGGTYGYVDLMVQLRLKEAAASQWPYVFCSVMPPMLADTTTLPSTLVVPDDCESRTGKLEAPPNSTFDILMTVYTSAASLASGSAQARFAGDVSEIRVP